MDLNHFVKLPDGSSDNYDVYMSVITAMCAEFKSEGTGGTRWVGWKQQTSIPSFSLKLPFYTNDPFLLEGVDRLLQAGPGWPAHQFLEMCLHFFLK